MRQIASSQQASLTPYRMSDLCKFGQMFAVDLEVSMPKISLLIKAKSFESLYFLSFFCPVIELYKPGSHVCQSQFICFSPLFFL